MHYGNNRAPASAPYARHFVLSAMTVKCCDYLPALTDCGRFGTGDCKLRMDCFDHLPPAQLVVEVERREGGGLQPVLEPTTDTSGAGLDWMTYIRPARDRHEQNVEVVLDCRTVGGGFRLRTSRVVKPGDELFVWYGDQLALDLGVPVLAPANIRGHAQYVCIECSASFRSPNTLKSHIMYHCVSSLRRTSPIVDHARASWYSMLPLLLPPVTSSPPLTNYFRLMAESSTCPTIADRLQALHDADVQGQLEGPDHDWSLLLSPMTSSSPPTNYFRLPPRSPTCPTKTPGKLHNAEGQSPARRSGHGKCWRPVCLDDGQSSGKEFDVQCRNSVTEKTITYGRRSTTGSRPSSLLNDQTTVDQERFEVSTTKPHGLSANRKRPASTAVPTGAETGSRSVTSSRSLRSAADGRHVCAFCGKRYSRRYGLTIHVRTHTGHKPLQCAVCRRPFGDPSNLNKHVRLHAGDADTPYRCRHCGKVLVRRRDLERHVRSRHPDAADTDSSPSKNHDNIAAVNKLLPVNAELPTCQTKTEIADVIR